MVPHQGELHQVTLNTSSLTRDGMDTFWNLLSVNSDLDGLEFVSTLEATDYPFYATQVRSHTGRYPSDPDPVPPREEHV